MALDNSLLNTQYYEVWIKANGGRGNQGKGVAPSPTLLCSSYWKESLGVALDNSRHFYNLYIYIYININHIFAQSAGAVEYTDCTSVEG